MDDEVTVSVGEAARRLGVASATIQRWVDSGVLNAERTAGGHRRIYVTEVRRLIASSRSAGLQGPIAAWIDVLLTGNASKVKSALMSSRQKADSWSVTADEVGSVLTEVGRRWEAGSCQIFEEHLASEALHRAAAMCVNEMHCGRNAPRAVLLTIQNERHTLGLSLAELVLAELGWDTTWVGEGPPAKELESVLEDLKPHMLVLSASGASTPSMVVNYQTALIHAAVGTDAQLVVGGSGPWREDPSLKQAVTFREFHGLLSGGNDQAFA